ncbi:hypothetical protein NEPAR06_0926 [Nematocida parisii]|uniref:Uncharacterized protein n=1 Tax=Nematocida parisii (strain ERTm3) TaxID=935791 RepID=I3EDR8_NEMP3|nr:hypothetical protein NEQG_02488 [Nematocida parisii ERTm3]KAI5127575.1 hypothetical protein NEPAR08_0945 [Nematocida parisii]KAI5127850.1 hypothetical protein NEPAR03_1130 [Nematocida parisii]KAI5141634.1 hypothetical protein NEPAR04_1111 [Nematocida parisii]KAI5145615.1 hypothetical protein NEPAR07_1815 [Nematocida parisii]
MTKYQRSRRIIMVTTIVGMLLKTYSAARMAMSPAIGTQIGQMCAPGFLKGTSILGSMGVNGMGGVANGIRINAPTLCVKQAPEPTEVLKMSPILKKLAQQQAVQAILNLQDSECKIGKVNPKTQACFLFKTIRAKAQAPVTAITTTGNALFLKNKDKVSTMIVIEKFGELTPQKKKPITLEQLVGRPISSTTFNEFDDILKREGNPVSRTKKNKCAACLKDLKENISLGGDMECDICSDSISMPLDFSALK